MSLVGLFKGKSALGFGYDTTAEKVTEGLDLSGKTYLVTGCNSGLGLETLRALALRGGHVIAAARTVDKARAACEQVDGETTPLECELSDLDSVRAAVQRVIGLGRPLDAIICNAGIMALPELQQRHGIELQFFTNHVGHFTLVTGLLDQLAPDGRVVVTSSNAHRRAPPEGIQFDNISGERDYRDWTAYGQSKLANALFARELARRFQGTERTAFSLHPGVIATNLGRHMRIPGIVRLLIPLVSALILKSVPAGAATQVYAATHPEPLQWNGAYLENCRLGDPTALARDDDLAARLWAKTEEIVAGR
jgi:WW domain-containing oxidoreductase